MDGEQQSGRQAGRAVHQLAAEAQEQDTHGRVKDHVEQVVGRRAQLAQQVVQAKGEHREWPVGFMAPLLRTKTRHWSFKLMIRSATCINASGNEGTF